MRSAARRLVAQIGDERSARVVVPYRAKPEQRAALQGVYDEEVKSRRQSGRKITISRVVEYVVGLGLDLYWARHEQGGEMDALAAEHGWDRRKTLTELLRRGLEKGGKK